MSSLEVAEQMAYDLLLEREPAAPEPPGRAALDAKIRRLLLPTLRG